MTRASVALLLWVGAALPSRAADPDPKSLLVPPATAARVAKLVTDLASRDFAERDNASKELRKFGRLALPALRSALETNSHPEVRMRVEFLLPAASAADLKARLDCFLADDEGKFTHDLPGGKEYFAAAGRTDGAKKLFREMVLSANRDLILSLDGAEEDIRPKYLARRDELGLPLTGYGYGGRSSADLSPADVTALLLAECHMPDRLATPSRGRAAGFFGSAGVQNAVHQALTADDRKDAVAAVLGRWMATRTQPRVAYQAVVALNRFDLPHALPAARRMVAGTVAGGPSSYRALALTYVARFGTADDLPLFEALFADTSLAATVSRGEGQQVIETRDLALAMALLLGGQNPADYGLTNRYPNSGDSVRYSAATFHFDGETDRQADAQRDAAFKKYAAWKAARKAEKK